MNDMKRLALLLITMCMMFTYVGCNTDDAIWGKWSFETESGTEALAFFSDGTCYLIDSSSIGTALTYTHDDETIEVKVDDETVIWFYSIKGDEMTLTIDGWSIVGQRVA